MRRRQQQEVFNLLQTVKQAQEAGDYAECQPHAIMDRIVYGAYKINIEGVDPTKDLSMWKVYGLDQSQAQ